MTRLEVPSDTHLKILEDQGAPVVVQEEVVHLLGVSTVVPV